MLLHRPCYKAVYRKGSTEGKTYSSTTVLSEIIDKLRAMVYFDATTYISIKLVAQQELLLLFTLF